MTHPKKIVYINCNIQKDIKKSLDKYCEAIGRTNTMAIERILKQFLDDYESVHNIAVSSKINN